MSETSPNNGYLTRWTLWVVVLASFVGFADAAFLSAKHFQGTVPPCVLFSGCDVVTTSRYAVIAGVPVALLGVLFYLAVLVLSIIYLDRKVTLALRLLAVLGTLGFLFTLFLVYLQLFVLNAICVYCMLSALSSTTIFALVLFALRRQKADSRGQNTP